MIGKDYLKWSKGIIALDGGTGTGKTTFCLQVLGTHAKRNGKKILYLCNRNKLVSDIVLNVSQLGLEKTVIIWTYQSLQQALIDNRKIPTADYIVADECHYFTSDSYNGYTDVAFSYLKKQGKTSVVIYMSATAKTFFNWLEKKLLLEPCNHYRIDPNYDHVDRLVFYKKKNLVSIINTILHDEADSKIVVFCNSAQRMLDLYSIYEDRAVYYCSSSTGDARLRRICSFDAIENESFLGRLLFTTSAADNGINFSDKSIRHIFTELTDLDSLIQSLGRKRVMATDDHCTFYIREYSVHEVQAFSYKNEMNVLAGKEYKTNPSMFVRDHMKDRAFYTKYFVFYPGYREKDPYDIMLNNMRWTKCYMNSLIYQTMNDKGFANAVIDELSQTLKYKVEFYDPLEKEKELLLSQIQECEGKKLYASDKMRIRTWFADAGCKLRYNGINTLNGALKDLFPKYGKRFMDTNPITHKEYRDNDRYDINGEINQHRNHRYWILA